MTFVPSDAPDWTSIPGGARYLGTLDMTGTYGLRQLNLDFAPGSFEGAIYVLQTGGPNSTSHSASISVQCLAPAITSAFQDVYASGSERIDPLVAPVSPIVGLTWRVQATASNASSSTWALYVFAIPAYPMARIVHDQVPFLVEQRGIPRRVPYDSQQRVLPGAGVQAIVTFAATANFRWILDHASFRLMGRGTADIVIAQLLDGAAAFYNQRMSVNATTGDRDEHVIGPMAGYSSAIGNALVVQFSAAPAAANFEVVSAGAYLTF